MIIYQLERGETADYASEELAKYIKLMCGEKSDICYENGNDGIVLALMDTLHISSGMENSLLDDAFEVKIDGFCGYIAGSNIRSILYGVYAYLKKAGCRFLRPGGDGEYVPQKNLSQFGADFREKADLRYRCECIEGSVRYETIRDHLYWLPKIGYNGYMLQGTSPYLWYDRWYSHQGNPFKKAQPLTVKQADEMTLKIEKDIKRAGLMLHSVGHDYMAPAFGLYGDVTEEEIDKAGIRKYLALVKGKRAIMYGGIRNTNFCYANTQVRKTIVDYFVQYMKEKPYVDCLQLWFADNRNNFCECEKCMATTVSDQYVEILNELDAAFTQNGIGVRIVFILYNDTCWPPIKEKLNTPDRFVMMTAVRQNFIDGYSKYAPDIAVPEHIHNSYNVPPNHFPITMGFLRDWKKVFDGDSFFFDYHLYSDHLADPGYCQVARRLCRDIKMMDKFDSQGLMNCCTYRKQLPTSYPVYLCGEMLMHKAADEEKVRKDYFSSCYGEEWEAAYSYLNTLSELFMPDLLRDTGVSAADEMFDDPNVQLRLPWMNNKAALESLGKISGVVKAFVPVIEKNLSLENLCQRKSWKLLQLHMPIVLMLADALCVGAGGDMAKAQEKCLALIEKLAETEDEYMPDLDFFLLMRRLRMMFGITNSIFAPVAR